MATSQQKSIILIGGIRKKTKVLRVRHVRHALNYGCTLQNNKNFFPDSDLLTVKAICGLSPTVGKVGAFCRRGRDKKENNFK